MFTIKMKRYRTPNVILIVLVRVGSLQNNTIFEHQTKNQTHVVSFVCTIIGLGEGNISYSLVQFAS